MPAFCCIVYQVYTNLTSSKIALTNFVEKMFKLCLPFVQCVQTFVECIWCDKTLAIYHSVIFIIFFFSISFIWSLLIIPPSFLYSINIKQTEENVECVATPMTLHSHGRMKAVEFIPVE